MVKRTTPQRLGNTVKSLPLDELSLAQFTDLHLHTNLPEICAKIELVTDSKSSWSCRELSLRLFCL